MNPRFVLRARPPAAVLDTGEGVSLRLSRGAEHFAAVPPGVRRALSRLAEGAADDELSFLADDGSLHALATWYQCLELLQRDGRLVCEVADAGRPLARCTASPPFRHGTGILPDSSRWALSRFAFVRRVDSVLVMESALSSARIELLDPRIANLTTALAVPMTVSEAEMHCTGLSPDVIRDFIGLLEYGGMLTCVDARGRRAEDTNPSLAAWGFADLLFHSRSRAFWIDGPDPHGAASLPPALKPPMSNEPIELPVPDTDANRETTDSFVDVLERRTSERVHGELPITVSQLGELLYRSARVRRVFSPDDQRAGLELTDRPYPGAGACYELETYLAVSQCNGLARGFYHYDPLGHRLEPIACDGADVNQLLHDASLAAGVDDEPQVLVILGARFQRMMAKYGAGSYALILKDAGVLMQTMCLVATSLHLASCILGSGEGERFNRAAATQPYEESSVGELVLGSKRASASQS